MFVFFCTTRLKLMPVYCVIMTGDVDLPSISLCIGCYNLVYNLLPVKLCFSFSVFFSYIYFSLFSKSHFAVHGKKYLHH